MSSTISQLSCFSSINRKLQFRRKLIPYSTFRSKSVVVMSFEGHGMETSSSESQTTLSYTSNVSKPHVEGISKPHQSREEHISGKMGISESLHENGSSPQKRAAKIHDFCFGIPFGGLVLSGGLVGFIFSRNPTTLSSGVIFGGALLALSTLSLKIWRQGKSSLPFILGQAVLSAALLWKNLQAFSLTKKLFPTGLFGFISAAMLFFYSYVIFSGGNPPPKKLKMSS